MKDHFKPVKRPIKPMSTGLEQPSTLSCLLDDGLTQFQEIQYRDHTHDTHDRTVVLTVPMKNPK